jgi:hypothetical protein
MSDQPRPETWTLLVRKVYRIGVESLWRHADGRYAVTLRNRTYAQRFDIPPDRVSLWCREFGLEVRR